MNPFVDLATLAVAVQQSGYIADPKVITALYLAYHLGKPLLLEGEPGVGKTELSYVAAKLLGHDEPIRLQCYEGLDVNLTTYDWNFRKQLLYLEATKQQPQAWEQMQDNLYGYDFLSQRPILKALLSPTTHVLLVDELDKAEEDLEALLLEVLSSHQVSIPELGTVHAVSKPLVILTSNAQRELSDATRRRCLYLYLDYPSMERELQIVYARLPMVNDLLATQVVSLTQKLRTLDLKKVPAIAETLDWVKALLILNTGSLTPDVVQATLNLVLKYQEDIATVTAKLPTLLKGLPQVAAKVDRPELSPQLQVTSEAEWQF